MGSTGGQATRGEGWEGGGRLRQESLMAGCAQRGAGDGGFGCVNSPARYGRKTTGREQNLRRGRVNGEREL